MSPLPKSRPPHGGLSRLIRAPARLFFLVVLTLMEVFGLPKVKRLPSMRRSADDSPERVQ